MNNKPLILVVEDDAAVRSLMAVTLDTQGYRYHLARNGAEALIEASTQQPAVMLLDLGLPDMEGVDIIRKVRDWTAMPIIVISARSEDADKVEALDAGADDYLTKPFAMGELLARVRAMLRRREDFTPDILTCGNLSLNMQNYELSSDAGSFVLSKIEYQMMELLMANQGRYFSTEDILVKVWGYDTEADVGIVWVYISYLRKKLASLKAKRNIGYTLEATE